VEIVLEFGENTVLITGWAFPELEDAAPANRQAKAYATIVFHEVFTLRPEPPSVSS
jgi:hypothetical protein